MTRGLSLLSLALTLLACSVAAGVAPAPARFILDAAPLAQPPAIDARLGEWKSAPHLALLGGGRWQPALPGAAYGGSSDLAARIYSAWDPGYLYLACEVYDDRLVPGPATRPWQGDCLILAFDPRKDGGQAYQADDSEFVVAFSPAAPPTLLRTYPPPRVGVVPSAKVAVRKDYRPPQPTDTAPMPRVKLTYELAIPWAQIKSGGKPGVTLGFALAVCDSDGTGRKGWLETGPGLVGAKAPARFALIGLRPAAARLPRLTAAPAPAATAAAQPAPVQPASPSPQAPAPLAPLPPLAPVSSPPAAPARPPAPAFTPQFSRPDVVRFDADCLTVANEDTLLLSASLHYFRVPRAEWADRLGKLAAAGITCVETPIPWNWHERREGSTDLADLDDFLTLAQRAGLFVMVRVGPYIGVEWDAGGYPAWLAAQRISYQTAAGPYLDCCGHWLERVLPVIKQHQVTAGGKVLLVALEASPATEALYRQTRAAGIEVPILTTGSPLARGAGSQLAVNLVDAISLFPRWDLAAAAGALAAQRQEEPAAPLTLAELGIGWFSTMGGLPSPAQPGVEAEQAEMAAKLALEQGAGIINLYLGAGGSNPGFWAADWITTTYDYAAPISETGALSRKYYRLRLVADLVNLFGPSLARARPAQSDLVKADLEEVSVSERINGNTAFLFLRPTLLPGSPEGAYHLRLTYLDPATGQAVTIPNTGKIALGNRESKVLVAGLSLAGMALRYATSEIAAISEAADRTLLVLYGEPGTPGELALAATSKPLVVGQPLAQEWDEAARTLTLNYLFSDQDQVVLVDNLELLLLAKERASRLWLAGTGNPRLPVITDAYLVSSARANREGADLTLHCRQGTAQVAMVLPATPSAVTVDGKQAPFAYDSTTRCLRFGLTTPEFYGDRPRPSLITRLFRAVQEGEPGLSQTFGSARALPEPLGGGTGWKQCQFQPLWELGILDNGYACYHLEFEPAGNNYLAVESYAADPKLVFMNGRLVPALCNNLKVTQADISDRARLGTNTLDIIYLNQGRANAGPRMAEPKGISGVQLLNLAGPAAGGQPLPKWKVRLVATLASEPAQAAPAFDDRGWETVEVGNGPQAVLEGYRGFAWYRTHASISEGDLASKMALLSFGGVDDACWVYVNGVKVGERASAGKAFQLDITSHLRPGDNLLAVAVENRGGSGGILQPVALALVSRAGPKLPSALVREGLYGEQNGYPQAAYNDERWHILKLGDWKRNHQAFASHDGMVWYRLKFSLPSRTGWHPAWVLRMAALGEATIYLNGRVLGKYTAAGPQSEFYLPPDWLAPGKPNMIAVAVRNDGGPGGLTQAAIAADPSCLVKERAVRVSF